VRSAAVLLVLLAACRGSSDQSPPAAACDDTRAISCNYFDVASGAWSPKAPSSMSLASACAPGGANGEIDAYAIPSSSYRLDRVAFVASGSAVRTGTGTLDASDDAGGTAYACGEPGARILTQLFCGRDVSTGTLTLRFTFDGRWGDGTPWTHQCDATLDVSP
jgi:hypothetical protein